MILKPSTDLEKRLKLEAFLTQESRRNANGFAIPSFVGSVASDDPSWIDEHENLLWNN